MNPAETGTFGVFCSDITKMRIGDYTCAMYALDTTDDPLSAAQREEVNNQTGNGSHYYYLGKFSQLGTADQNTPEFNVIGNVNSHVTNGLVWLVKVKKGVLMPTQILGRGNYATMGYYFGLVNGRKITIDNRDFVMQLPSVDDYQALVSDMGSNTAEALKKLINNDFYSEFVRNYYRYPEQAETQSITDSGTTRINSIPIEWLNFNVTDDSSSSYNRNFDTGYLTNNELFDHKDEYYVLRLTMTRWIRPVLKYVDDPRCQSIYV